MLSDKRGNGINEKPTEDAELLPVDPLQLQADKKAILMISGTKNNVILNLIKSLPLLSGDPLAASCNDQSASSQSSPFLLDIAACSIYR